jgi:hypothetical protein
MRTTSSGKRKREKLKSFLFLNPYLLLFLVQNLRLALVDQLAADTLRQLDPTTQLAALLMHTIAG